MSPPKPRREFRGVWVATVGNIDWPSRPGLPSEQQKAELLAILDQAVRLRLNAVIFQVRPCCDALYASPLEPWSEYLSGEMGRPPSPPYDPLEFAVAEAHRRGLELHAWFNPYRARTPNAKSPVAANHVSKLHPAMVKRYGGYQWLDPGDKNVQAHILRVLLDVARRYDIDAVHIDDYFYPEPQKDTLGRVLPFPDWASWRRYQAGGGRLSREDWRRDNINQFIQRFYEALKAEKPWVKFGVSPSGIWRPGNPPQIKGGDPYAQIYADSRKWWNQGWLDYLAPQLYWEIEPPAQSYPVLLKWWAEQNLRRRHLWPGNSVSRLATGRSATEIVNQVRLTRQQVGASGNIFWNCRPLLQNQASIVEALRHDVYTEAALIPASTWLDPARPEKPQLLIEPLKAAGQWKTRWDSTGQEKVWLWVLQIRRSQDWTLEILPGRETTRTFQLAPQVLAITAVDRCGNTSIPLVLEQQELSSR